MLRFKLSALLILLISLFTVTPAGAAVGEKTTYKVGLVMGASKDKRIEVDVLNLATAAFYQTRRFDIVERDQLNAVFTEKDLQGFLGKGNKKLSDVLGLDLLGILSYTIETRKSGAIARNVVTLDVRLADVKTGAIVGTITSERNSLTPPSTVREASHQLFQSIREAFPPFGYIIKATGNEVVVDLGGEAGLKKGDFLEIVREGEEIIHPKTGEVLPAEMIVVGELKVVSTTPHLSNCKLKSKGEASVGRSVRLKERNEKWKDLVGKVRDNAGILFRR